MSRYTTVVMSVFSLALASTPALAQGQSGQQGPGVTVTNTAANPVPVVMPSLPLPVSIGAPLQVVVPEPLAVTGKLTVNDPAEAAYVQYDGATIPSGHVNIQLSLGMVPAGKRLVVEHVGAACEMAPDDEIYRVTIWISKSTGAGWSSFAVPLGVVQKASTYDGKTSASVSQSLRLYSDGGAGGLFVDVRRRNTTQEAQCWAVVSGYTVDVP